MPLVRIDLTADRPPQQRRAIADAIHSSLVEVLGIPMKDRFQIITAHQAEDIIADDAGLGFDRSPAVVIVHIFTQTGRSTQTKQHLFIAVSEALVDVGVGEEDLFIAVSENSPSDWSFGFGAAQYITGELEIPSRAGS
ncbi:tautomerase family protein [Rhodococcus sp. 077-4]|uniref:tautomerase family protein n=1 Tax=Rhodococcus sp. 077-4 TaxID=2789271 RepID=UPI0039F47790